MIVMLINVPSNLLKSACTQNILCATFYQHSAIFRTPCKTYVQTHFLKEKFMWAPSFLLCAHFTTCVHTRTA